LIVNENDAPKIELNTKTYDETDVAVKGKEIVLELGPMVDEDKAVVAGEPFTCKDENMLDADVVAGNGASHENPNAS
jgi:hypothetical protein